MGQRQRAIKLRRQFDRFSPRLKKHWDWFESHCPEFCDMRDKAIAHLDVILVGKKYELPRVTGPTWEAVKEAIRRLIDVAEILSLILHQREGPLTRSSEKRAGMHERFGGSPRPSRIAAGVFGLVRRKRSPPKSVSSCESRDSLISDGVSLARCGYCPFLAKGSCQRLLAQIAPIL
jgi:hypothetical protein